MNSGDNLKALIDDEIKSLFKDLATDEGFQDYKIENASYSLKGKGFVSDVTAIVIIGKDKSGKEKKLPLIIKTASKSDTVRTETALTKAFEREIFIYDVVIPKFRTLENEKSLTPFSCLAKCYKTSIIEKSEIVVLEDVKEIGYNLLKSQTGMEHDHTSLVMEEYGRWHALSLAMRDQKPETFKTLTDNMDDIFYLYMEEAGFTKSFENRCQKALETLDPVVHEKTYHTYKKFIDVKIKEFLRNLPNFVDNYSVILHGDGWANNMMFKCDDKSNPEKPTKLCLLDFQLSRLGPPVLDLSYFMYSCCSERVIDNYEFYLDVYYNSLSTYLGKLGSNSEEVYPRSIFREQWKKYSRFGLICSMLIIQVLLSEDIKNFEETAETGKSASDAFIYEIPNWEVYKKRAKHVILRFVNNEFI